MAVNDASIDEKNLVPEVFAISTAIQGAAVDASEAQTLLEDKKTYYKYIKSKKWKELRTGVTPIDKIPKPSATDVNNIIDSDEEVYAAQQELDICQNEYTTHKSYLACLESKKRALELLVKIAVAGWFSDVKVFDAEAVSTYISASGEIEDPLSDRKAMRERKRRNALAEEEISP